MSKRKSTIPLITKYFKNSKTSAQSSDSLALSENTDTASITDDGADDGTVGVPSTSTSCSGTSTSNVYSKILNKPDDCDSLDIGLFITADPQILSDDIKYSLLRKTWVPPEQYKFPAGERNLKFQRKWLYEHPWLSYSKLKDGAYCKYCSIFSFESSDVGKGNHIKLGKFVRLPLVRWKKARDDFREHEATEYHKKYSVMADNFLSVHTKKTPNVVAQVYSGRHIQVLENRKKIMPIIKTVVLCGRQEIALRGHSDSGPLLLEDSEINDGNFRALLRYRIDGGDNTLKEHILNSASNAMYLSPKIQNDIIETCGEIIQESLVEKVNKAHCFSVLADETADISGVEQFSLTVRYTEKDTHGKFILREDFLKFVPVHDMRGLALATTLLDSLTELGVNIKHMRGQGFDGASNMSGQFQGCAKFVQEKCPQAVYLHCASHCFNLALTHACKVPVVRNCLGTMKEVITFIRASPKRETALKKIVQDFNPSSKKTRLLKFCETRWVEHLDAILLFKDLFEVICQALSDMQNLPWDNETSSKAYNLLSAMEKSTFVAAMTVTSKIFALSQNLSTSLQADSIDLVYFLKHADNLKKELQSMREQSEQKFHSLFVEASEICKVANIEVEIPRTTKRQVHRENFNTQDPEEYYRLSIFNPFLEYFLEQIDIRFLKHRKLLESLSCLLPQQCCTLEDDELKDVAESLSTFWPDDVVHFNLTLESEMMMWRRKWIEFPNNLQKPKYFLTSLDECNNDLFPGVHAFLKIGATLPVSVATSERSFSTLRRIKSYTRSTMGQPRLNGLALMSVHRDVALNLDHILDEMAKKKTRKLDFHL